MESQVESAQRMYDARADNYEDSWHPDYSKRFVGLLPIKSGDRVLSLCCGTGLDAFLAAERVGDRGQVLGVDVSEKMLAKAVARQTAEPELGNRIKLIQHDVTSLQTLPEIKEESFDFIMCSCAFVLLENPTQVIDGWKRYLKSGGLLAVDIPHENNLRSGLLVERVAKRLGFPFPSNRTWVRSRQTFADMLTAQGYKMDRIVDLEKTQGKRSTFNTVNDADDQFDYIVYMVLPASLKTEDFKQRGRPVFKEEFAALANDEGRIEVIDSQYVYLATKP